VPPLALVALYDAALLGVAASAALVQPAFAPWLAAADSRAPASSPTCCAASRSAGAAWPACSTSRPRRCSSPGSSRRCCGASTAALGADAQARAVNALAARLPFLRLFSSALASQALLSATSFALGLLLIRYTSDHEYGSYALVLGAVVLARRCSTPSSGPPW
jgi:hypothetical protein